MNRNVRLRATFLLLLFLGQLLYPTASFALTGGPSQPEVESFEPITTDQMVDPFTGDFNYNLPLMTVPGPGGGYPINIAYHAGVSMDEEASWVGLGWNINPGVINRSLRGIPDDFDGEKIMERTIMKPVNTYSAYMKSRLSETEILGAEFVTGIAGSASATISIDNYRGVSLETDFGMNFLLARNHSPKKEKSTTFNEEDTENGCKETETTTEKSKYFRTKYSLGFNYSSRNTMAKYNQGLDFSKVYEKSVTTYNNGTIESSNNQSKSYDGGTFSFSTINNSQSSNQIWKTYSVRAAGTFGINSGPLSGETFDLGLIYSRSSLKNPGDRKTFENPAYGYFYAENARRDTSDLSDFYFDNDNTFTKKTPRIITAVANHDLFLMSGQGLSGMFRAQKRGIGVFAENTVKASSITVNSNSEFDSFVSTQLGQTSEVSHGRARIGTITGQASTKLDDLKFGSTYFKLVGAFNGHNSSSNDISVDFSVGVPSPSMETISPENHGPRPTFDLNSTGSYSHANNFLKNNSNSSTNIEYFTQNEKATFASSNNGQCISLEDSEELSNIVYDPESRQIAEYKIRKTDGQIYVYGLPVMNTEQIERSFSVEQSGATPRSLQTSYSGGEDDTDQNQKGVANLYHEKKIPKYAHSYMITQILSNDYIDRTANGPSEDDYGAYVKFSYSKFADRKWRIPYYGANYSPGYISDYSDDQASYIEGTKDVYFVKYIETKTHIAVFKISPRSDAHFSASQDLSDLNSSIIGENNYKLDRIELYQKNESGEPGILIQTINFSYDYSSCPGIPNFSLIPNETSILPGGESNGKLTLRKIQFSYGENNIIKETPYEFEYYQNNSLNHYNLKNVDKWNQPFKRNSSDAYDNQINPFMNPYLHEYDINERRESANLFNLRTIIFPSGSRITINYEPDDYAFVQDKNAMNMLKIAGIGDVSNTDIKFLNDNDCKLKNDFRRIYFILDSEISSIAEGENAVAKSIAGIDSIYFKLCLELKNHPIVGIAQDYVDCFAKFEGTSGFIEDSNSPNFGYGYLDINKIESMADGLGFLPQSVRNPLRYSGISYLQNSRPDLHDINSLDPGASNGLVLEAILAAATSVTGFTNVAVLGGFCNKFSTEYPSFIRLNDSDNRKFGGGIRVRSIETSNSTTFSNTNIAYQDYTTLYFYSLEDGSSSGVAENEPSNGYEESALYQPHFYGSNKYFGLYRKQYVQEKAMLAFYPSPSVGYSRVLTFRKAQNQSDENSRDGIIENIFYTAKEFPVKEESTSMPESKRVSFTFPLVVAGGAISFSNFAASQKFKVVLNNMHGKPKEINSYAIPEDVEDFNRLLLLNPSTSLNFEYFEDNKVKVLLDEFGTIQSRQIGINVDGYLGELQRSSWDLSGGVDVNMNSFFAGFVPSAYPQCSYGEQFGRFLTATTVFYRNAILKSQTSTINGIITKTENKLFEANTGRALVTETTIDGKNPITSFDIPAYWNYPILGAAGQNYRYSVNDGSLLEQNGSTSNLDFTISNGYVTCSNNQYDFTNFFEKGDVILLNNGIETKYYWIIEVFSNSIYIVDQENTIPQNSNTVDKMIVMQSGFKNQQDFNSGSITISGKFEDLVINSVLNLINTELESIPVSEFEGQTTLNIPIDICSKLINFSFRPSGGNGIISDFRISTDKPSEYANTHFNDFVSSNLLYMTNSYFQIERTENGQFVLQIEGENGYENPNFTSSPFYLSALNFRSLDNVINASAVEYSDEIPLYANNDFISTSSGNPYLNGTKGQWRPVRNYSYQGDRVYRQNNSSTASEGTNSHEDGLLFCFPNFVWAGDNTRQFNEENNWLMSNEITVYNPNGLALEERNALGIYAAQLTTVKENLVLCSGSNSKMSDIGCLSFEENSIESFNPGHLNLLGSFATTTSNSHSGKKSLVVNSGTTDLIHFAGANSTSNSEFRASNSTKYLSQFWVKFDPTISTPYFSIVDNSGNSIAQAQITNIGKPIDGWYLVTVTLGVPNEGCNLRINAPQQNILIDDIRIQPLNSTMATYVYDYQNYRLLAQLDNQNYATFYNYSLDGSLTQVKRETASGVYTINSMNQNTK